MSLFLIFTDTLEMENSILGYLTCENFGFHIVRMPCYCSSVTSKMFYGSIAAEFFKISRATSKIEDLNCYCKQLLSRIIKTWANKENQIFLNKMIQRHQEVFVKYNKSIEEVIQAIGFWIWIKKWKSNIFSYIRLVHILHSFILSVFLYTLIISNKYFSTCISIYLYLFLFFSYFLYTCLYICSYYIFFFAWFISTFVNVSIGCYFYLFFYVHIYFLYILFYNFYICFFLRVYLYISIFVYF